MEKSLFRFQSNFNSTQLIGAHYYSSKKYLGKKIRLFFLQDLGACHEDYENLFKSIFKHYKNKIEIYTFDYLGYGRSLGSPSDLTDLSICLNDFKSFLNLVSKSVENLDESKNILCGHKIGADLAITFSVNIQPYFEKKFEKNILLFPLLKNPILDTNQWESGKGQIAKLIKSIPVKVPIRFDMAKSRQDLCQFNFEGTSDILNRFYDLTTIEAIKNFYQDFYSHSYFLSTNSLFILDNTRIKTDNTFLSGIDRSVASIKVFNTEEVRFEQNSHRLKIGNKILLSISKFIDEDFNNTESGRLENASF